jgi:hypothetical protein
MPNSHFHALLYIIKYWMTVVQSAKPEEQTLNELSVALGPLVLRPEVFSLRIKKLERNKIDPAR